MFYQPHFCSFYNVFAIKTLVNTFKTLIVKKWFVNPLLYCNQSQNCEKLTVCYNFVARFWKEKAAKLTSTTAAVWSFENQSICKPKAAAATCWAIAKNSHWRQNRGSTTTTVYCGQGKVTLDIGKSQLTSGMTFCSPLVFKFHSEKTSKRHQLLMTFPCVFRFLTKNTRKSHWKLMSFQWNPFVFILMTVLFSFKIKKLD